ncbi:hypothetical protein [Maricaulis sp.]|uniref:hypothetical protein n=1 Tax=Maricaulis sp. TaxID=1486257 RepID=UPI00329884E1
MNDARRSAWTNPPAEDFDQAENTPEPQATRPAAHAGDACPDCGEVHANRQVFESLEEAQLYLQAFKDDFLQLAARYPKISWVIGAFSRTPAGIQMERGMDCTAQMVGEMIDDLMMSKDSIRQAARNANRRKLAELGAAVTNAPNADGSTVQ